MENKLNISEKGELLGLLDERVVRFLEDQTGLPIYKESIDRKVSHSIETIKAALDINSELETPLNPNLAAIIAVLHDVGRFDQAKRGDGVQMSDPLGKRENEVSLTIEPIIKSADLKRVIRKKDLSLVKEAIEAHGVTNYTGKNPYAWLLRDADRLALARAVEVQFKVYEANSKPEEEWILEEDDSKLKNEGLSETLLDLFMEGEVIPPKQVQTTADAMLRFLSWFPNLHFNETKEIFLREKLVEKILTQIKRNRLQVSKEKIAMIESKVKSWEELND